MPNLLAMPDDPRSPEVRVLLDRHLAFGRSHSPPEDVHALDVEGLIADDVTFFSIRNGDDVLGIGALLQIDARQGEIKSMHTAEAARGTGVARLMLEHLLGVARDRGYDRVNLETGSMEAFAPARALYRSAGFREGAPFGAYSPSRHSTFMTLDLRSPAVSVDEASAS